MPEPDGILIVDEGALTGHLREGAEEYLHAERPIGPINPKARLRRRIRRVIIHYEDIFEVVDAVYDPVNDLPPEEPRPAVSQADGFIDFSVGR
ncbi:MAG: hypothetical protein IT406_03940 [Candidatus Yanofskybacteria bacterium]|nr:hypothetical protein [Candidatus Yanofskybacteria bacterium]